MPRRLGTATPAIARHAGSRAQRRSDPGRCLGNGQRICGAPTPPRRSRGGCRNIRTTALRVWPTHAHMQPSAWTGRSMAHRTPIPAPPGQHTAARLVRAEPERNLGLRSAAGSVGRSSGQTTTPRPRCAGCPDEARRSGSARTGRRPARADLLCYLQAWRHQLRSRRIRASRLVAFLIAGSSKSSVRRSYIRP